MNQITLVKIAMHILERLMKGLTLEFAVTRVFELESKMDHPINRLMLQTYLKKVEIGLKKNQKEHYENIAGDLAQNCRDMRLEERKKENPGEEQPESLKETHKMVSEVLESAAAEGDIPEGGRTLASVGEQFSRMQARYMRDSGQKTATFRQFELSGYEKMIDRLMENPLQSSQAHDKPEMHGKILELKNALQV